MTSTSQPVATINPLRALAAFGQSIWLDYIRRSSITSGELKRLIDEDGLRGVTSNPSIFEKAIAGSTDYDQAFASMTKSEDRDAKHLYEQLAIADIQAAADLLRPAYDETKRRDGYVSLEVSPYLANDTNGTIDEARRLWATVNRPNVMIKVPGTPAGVPAIQRLTAEGININVTLLFARAAYEAVAVAFTAGLEERVQAGQAIDHLASVASFFVSRIDTAVDNLLTAKIKSASDSTRGTFESLLGKVAIANAKLAYQMYLSRIETPRWRALAAKGAQSQRLLWASTGTKNPAYRDVLYVEELIGPDTVNTIPPATLDAFREHGRPRASLTEDIEGARATLSALETAGISLDEVTAKLLDDAVRLFADAFDKLLGAVERKRVSLLGPQINRLRYTVAKALETKIKASLDEWRVSGKIRRLWARDASVWTGQDESKWLGWLGITNEIVAHSGPLQQAAAEIKNEGFTNALLLGMGGSSLCPEVMKMTFGKIDSYPELHVLDSTDPAQVKAFENKVDLGKTIFIVSSKSGGTLEPNIFKQYFFERAKAAVGTEKVGSRFIAITDPGSKMQQIAEQDGFRYVFFGDPAIGGRYSALSAFGMVPAAIMGVDVAAFLDRAEEMVLSCAPSVPAEENPGVVLGTVMGVLGSSGRDKVTIITSPAIGDLGAWLEQLIAESTGKIGKGLIPIDGEQVAGADKYGSDRLFVYVRLESAADPTQDTMVDALESGGHAVVRILVADPYELGEEFFRWELATAVAGSILGINPFDQPDVEASKMVTRELTSAYEKAGSLPPEQPILEGGGLKLFTDETNTEALRSSARGSAVADYLRAHVSRLQPGDYFALLAYVEMNERHRDALQRIRHLVRDRFRVATCLGFGPRFLHSTGQLYKGGPNTGVFLQITCDDALDIPVPGQKYTFGVVKAAQARGDFQVLIERHRRALRVHLGKDVEAGLRALEQALQ